MKLYRLLIVSFDFYILDFIEVKNGKMPGTSAVQNYDHAQRAKMKKLFEDFDQDNSGKLDCREFQLLLQKFGISLPYEQCVKCITQQTGGNEELTFEDFLDIYPKIKPKSFEEEIKNAFELVDLDGSGKLGKDEIKQMMISAGVKDITDLEVEFLISEYDKDGDDELDFIEFKAFMMDDISDTRTFSTRPVDNVKPSATEDAEEIKPY
ncbi:neo-calmodulin-like [Convolutriloba macropyga]|uniref:neo-calmodulin-like n=1 Tax=Convolutriloba macropyga TaxID=536237 RepID=UPI003F5212B5